MCYYNSVEITKDKLISMAEWDLGQTEFVRKSQSGFDYDNYPIITNHNGNLAPGFGTLGVHPLLV